MSEDIGLSASWKVDWTKGYLAFVDHHAGLSLRDVEKIATLCMVTPSPREHPEARSHLYFGMLVLHVLAPYSVDKARRGKLTEEDVFSVLRLNHQQTERAFNREANAVWRLVTATNADPRPRYLDEALSELFADIDPRELLREVISETLDVFQILS